MADSFNGSGAFIVCVHIGGFFFADRVTPATAKPYDSPSRVTLIECEFQCEIFSKAR